MQIKSNSKANQQERKTSKGIQLFQILEKEAGAEIRNGFEYDHQRRATVGSWSDAAFRASCSFSHDPDYDRWFIADA